MVETGTDNTVRAYQAAVTALNTEFRLPQGNAVGNVAFLPAGGATGVGAVVGDHAHRQFIASPHHHLCGDFPDKARCFGRNGGVQLAVAADLVRQFHPVQVLKRCVHCLEVLLDNIRSLA